MKELEGVTGAEVNLETVKVEVTYNNSKVSLEAMKAAVEDQGYDKA